MSGIGFPFTTPPPIWIPCPNQNAFIGNHVATRLTDGVDVTVRFEAYIPEGFSLAYAYIILVPGGTGNLRRSVDTDFGERCVENYNAHSDAIAAGQVAVTINRLECLDIMAALTGLYGRDMLGIEFTRFGSDVLDTVGADCYLLGVLLISAPDP